MQALPPVIEAYPVHHLPIIKAYADQLGLVSLINHYVPTEMDVDAGTVVLNQSTGDSYTHAAILACASAVKRSTAAVIAGA